MRACVRAGRGGRGGAGLLPAVRFSFVEAPSCGHGKYCATKEQLPTQTGPWIKKNPLQAARIRGVFRKYRRGVLRVGKLRDHGTETALRAPPRAGPAGQGCARGGGRAPRAPPTGRWAGPQALGWTASASSSQAPGGTLSLRRARGLGGPGAAVARSRGAPAARVALHPALLLPSPVPPGGRPDGPESRVLLLNPSWAANCWARWVTPPGDEGGRPLTGCWLAAARGWVLGLRAKERDTQSQGGPAWSQ